MVPPRTQGRTAPMRATARPTSGLGSADPALELREMSSTPPATSHSMSIRREAGLPVEDSRDAGIAAQACTGAVFALRQGTGTGDSTQGPRPRPAVLPGATCDPASCIRAPIPRRRWPTAGNRSALSPRPPSTVRHRAGAGAGSGCRVPSPRQASRVLRATYRISLPAGGGSDRLTWAAVGPHRF